MTENEEFERAVARQLRQFQRGPRERPAKRVEADHRRKGITVRLAVRERHLGPEMEMTVHVPTLSRLEARIEAERRARNLGWTPAFVIDFIED